jgi:mRNA interferase RelE/StbE
LAWTIEFDEHARRQLKKLDPQTAARLYAFLRDRVAPLDDPRQLGKALHGSTLGAFWAYRVGDFRIICDLHDHRLVVLVLALGNRRDVYRQSR